MMALFDRYVYYGIDIEKEIEINSKDELDRQINIYAASIAEILSRFLMSFRSRKEIIKEYINKHPISEFNVDNNKKENIVNEMPFIIEYFFELIELETHRYEDQIEECWEWVYNDSRNMIAELNNVSINSEEQMEIADNSVGDNAEDNHNNSNE